MATKAADTNEKPIIGFLAVLYASAFLGGFNENLLNMALVPITTEYAIDSATVQWLVSGYMIVATVVVSCMAFFFRRVKLRTLFLAGSLFTLVGSILGVAASNFITLLIARLVQALGSGIFIPLMINTVLTIAPRNRVGAFMGIGSATVTFGPAFAPVVTGGIVTGLGWHSVFWFPIIAIVCIMVAGIKLTRNLPTVDTSLDILSVVLSAVLLTSLTMGLAELTLNLPLAIAALVIAVASIVAFGVRQTRCKHPLIDLTPLHMKEFWPTLIMTTVAMMSSFSLSVMLPQYFQGAMEMEAFTAGLIILVPILANAGSTVISGRMMDRYGEVPLIPLGFGVVFTGFLLTALVSTMFSVPVMFTAALITFLGIGMIFSPSQTSGLRALPPELNPFGVALNTTFLQIAACIGPSLYMGILASAQVNGAAAGIESTLAVARGFRTAMYVGAAIAACGFAVALPHFLAARKRRLNQQEIAEAAPAETSTLGKIMSSDVFTLAPDTKVREAMRQLIDRHVSGMPIVGEDGRLQGFVSDGDIMRYLADKHPDITGPYSFMEQANRQTMDERLKSLLDMPVSEIATTNVITLPAGSSLEDAANLLAQYKLKKVPVTHNGELVGILSRSDVMRYAMEQAL